jgi:type I restriction enzyme S subunit
MTTELGVFPSDWRVDRFDSLFDVQQGKQVSKKNRIGGNQRPFLRTKNVFWNRLESNDLDEMHFSEADEIRLALKRNDLLICEGGDIGRTAMWRGTIPNCYYQNHLHRARIRTPETADAQFVLFWLWYAFEFGNLYFGRGNVTTIPNFSQCELPLAIPPLVEQRKIAGVLGLVQRAMKQQERLIALTTELKRTLLHQLFTHGLRGEPQKQTEIGPVPQSWEVKHLEVVATIIMGQSPDGDSYNADGHGVPLINGPVEFGPGALSKTLEVKFTTEPTKLCEVDDLILCVRGSTTGRTNVANGRACIGRGVAAVRAQECQEYLSQFMVSIRDRIYSMGTGTTFPNISGSQIREILVPVPPSDVQTEIGGILATVDRKQGLLEHKHAALTALFRTLLHQLMTGQIRVNGLDEDSLTGE